MLSCSVGTDGATPLRCKFFAARSIIENGDEATQTDRTGAIFSSESGWGAASRPIQHVS
jgi:hypothetical protein